MVRPHRQAVEKYSEEAWEDLGATDYAEVVHILAGLPTELEPEDETAKRFDLLILKIQLAMIQASAEYTRLHDLVKEIASRLKDKQTIPMVYAQIELIEDLQLYPPQTGPLKSRGFRARMTLEGQNAEEQIQ